MRRIAAAVLVTLAVMAGSLARPDSARAYWSVPVAYSGGGNWALAQAATLSSPVSPTATTDGAGAITVSWTLPASQLAGAQYRVSRTAPSSATVCTVSSATTSCQDTGLAPATAYTYSVVALLSNWQTTAATVAATTSTPSYSITLSASPYTAGSAITVQTVRAMNGATVDTTFAGSRTITWSGLPTSPAPASRAPSYPTTSATFTAGVATLNSGFTAYASGSNSLVATDAAVPAITGSTTISLASAAASRLVVSAASTATAGAAVTGITLTARDAYDNTATTYATSQTITWSGPATSPAPASRAPTLPATAVTFSNGVSTTALSATLFAAGTNTLTATDAGARTGSATIAVAAVAASAVSVVSGSNQYETTSLAYANPLAAKVTDAYSNPVSGATVTFSAPASGASGTFANGTRTTAATSDSGGNATSSVFTANASAGTYTVTAAASSGSASFSLTNQAPLAITGITSADGGGGLGAGHGELGDTFSVTFNNALDPATVATGTTQTITLVGGGNQTTIMMTGLTTVAGFVIPSNYEKSGNTSSASGNLTLSNGNKTVTFTISSSFSNTGNVKTGSSNAFTFVLLGTIADLGGSTVVAAYSQPAILLF
ncbi:MAG TPA: fibronectin type III domain-containing protein [Acidimicrobiales bacterium]|nr:fibronectin type III domain-containing protein [Acidimicrobiales bacterium]